MTIKQTGDKMNEKRRNSRMTPRELAYEALLAIERDGRQSHLVLRDLLHDSGQALLTKENSEAETIREAAGSGRQKESAGSGMDSRDRAFVIRLVEGTVEYRLQLDWVIDQFSKTKTAKMRPGIREILRMAVYQILYMDSVPDRAAVSEAVDLAVHRGFSGLRGFVNGVLRAIAREKNCLSWPEHTDGKNLSKTLSIRYSVSEEILNAWLPRFGAEKTEAVCKAFLEDRPLTAHGFRDTESNPPGGGSDTQDHLEATGILEGSFFLKKGIEPASIPAFREGRLYVQDLSSQIAMASVGIQPGDRVLDLCAAPGGKSFLAAERGASVLARDLTEEKTAMIRENARRLHCYHNDVKDWSRFIGNTEGVFVQTADAGIFAPDLENVFDVVIADLPCSGFGVAGRKPEIKYKPYRETVRPLAELQRKILANAARYVRPGGKLLYSTCTIAEEENEANVRWLLENSGHPYTFKRGGISGKIRELLQEHGVSIGEYGIQLLPCDGPWDGFFYAVMEKTRSRRE